MLMFYVMYVLFFYPVIARTSRSVSIKCSLQKKKEDMHSPVAVMFVTCC